MSFPCLQEYSCQIVNSLQRLDFLRRIANRSKRQLLPCGARDKILQTKFWNMTWAEMHQYLFIEEHVNEASNYATFQTYQQNILTPEGSEFYFDIFGYEGDLRGGVLSFAWMRKSSFYDITCYRLCSMIMFLSNGSF